MQLDRDQLPLRARLEQLGVDAERDDPVVAGEALGGRGGRRLGGGDQRIEPREQLLAQRPSRWVPEPLRREERCDSERLRVAEREVGDARQPGLEPVHDVELPLLERQVQVRAHPDRDAEARPA